MGVMYEAPEKSRRMGPDAAILVKNVKNRRSIRKFKEAPLSELELHTILEAGIAAPSSKNRQPWHFTVVRGNAREELLRVMEQGLSLEIKAQNRFYRKVPL